MNILIVDDELLAREGLFALVSRCLPDSNVALAATLQEATARVAAGGIDLIFLDLRLNGGASGLELLRRIKDDTDVHCKVVVVSGIEDPLVVQEAFRCGASGFVEKRAADYAAFRAAIEQAAREGVHVPGKTMGRLRAVFASRGALPDLQACIEALPRRQREIADLVAAGASNKRIARDLGIAESSVKSHVSTLFRKLRVANRLEFLALLATQRGGDAAPHENA